MKCLFLDFDGVFNSSSNNFKLFLNDYKFKIHFDICLIENFLKLFNFCREHDIKICITSSHSINKTIKDWKNLIVKTFRVFIPEVIIGLDSKQDKDRGLFIKDFITDNNIKEYLIIDDDIKDIQPYHKSENILHIDKEYGLTTYNLLKIQNYFKI